jgi:hypothetical protein
MMEAGAPDYSDEAWSRRVGGVSAQHVGRLRRVHEQFGEVHEQYPGLYWSHFLAALDWPDAEMWLEGAVQSGWSVAQMRNQRWEATGAAADKKPRAEDILVAELDEDGGPPDERGTQELTPSVGVVRDPDRKSGPEREGHEPDALPEPVAVDSAQPAGAAGEPATAAAGLFENLPELPDDLSDAVEALKVAILSHKLSGWQEVPREAVLRALDALKQLASDSH